MHLIEEIKGQLKGKDITIVLPEGEDMRVVEAARILHEEGIVRVILLKTKEDKVDLPSDLRVIERDDYDLTDMVEALYERRKGKWDKDKCRELLQNDANYFGTMLVYLNEADGLVSGANHSTASTVRPALQIIKMKEGFSKTSGVFVMLKDNEKLLFSDCAINIAPTSEDLAENAILSYETAKTFGIEEPRLALLSFSTKGSAESEETEKVARAYEIVKEKHPEILIDGEIQFDAAYVEKVGKKKAPDSPVAGKANVFIFPSLEAGNIGYKIAQRMGGYEAIGPILQGLNYPVNDLSRGCSVEDIVALSYLTASQSK